MRRCLQNNCSRRGSFNVQGSTAAVYCKRHAADGMVNVRSRRCSHSSCSRRPSFNQEGSKTDNCRKHAEDGGANVSSRRCLRDCCMLQPSFNYEGSMTPAFCRTHAEVGMVDARSNRCAVCSRTEKLSFNYQLRGQQVRLGTAGNMPRTAWSTSLACAAHVTLARGDRHLTTKATRRHDRRHSQALFT